MSLITIGTDLVDVCDIAIVAASGSTCVVYFRDGTYISSALTAAVQAAAVNGAGEGALLTTVVTSSNFGSCYIAGQQVKRVRAAGANSIWELWSGLGPALVSGVDATAAGVLIDATTTGGGSSGVWTPDAVRVAGGVPTIVSSTERSYTLVDGIVTTILQFDILSIPGCSASGIRVTNFPLWDRLAALQNVVGHVQTPTTITPLSLAWSGFPILSADFNMPLLGAGGTAGVQAIFQYPATA